jgi:phosphatidylinositol 4-kinase
LRIYNLALALEILTEVAPALHGLYRAIISTSFPWSTIQWRHICTHLSDLCSSEIIDRLNRLLVDIIQKEDADDDTVRFIQTFIGRYVSRGRPLSGYFIICCVIETQWTVLAQALAPSQEPRRYGGDVVEAAAANEAWLSLMRRAAIDLGDIDKKTKMALKDTIAYAMSCFADLLEQIKEMEKEPSLDTYAWETMSESLVRGDLLKLQY